jgi:hypothetical protein
MRRTEIWLLSASTASRYFPSRSYLGRALGGEARAPALNGESASGVSEPSACRVNPSMVLAGAVLPSEDVS